MRLERLDFLEQIFFLCTHNLCQPKNSETRIFTANSRQASTRLVRVRMLILILVYLRPGITVADIDGVQVQPHQYALGGG